MRNATSLPIRFLCVACWIIVDSAVHGWNLPFHRKAMTAAGIDASTTNMPTIPSQIPPSLDVLSDMTQTNLQRFFAKVSETSVFVTKYFQAVYQFALSVILYKPPVGIVAIFGLHRVFTKLTKSPTTIQEIHNNQENGRSKGRKFFLDMDDADYNLHGGIDHVRAKLCRFALGNRHHQLVRGLEISHHPGDSLVRLVQELANTMSLPQQQTTDTDRTVVISRMLLQVRAIDALARIARDRLLKVSFRLQRTCDHYTSRLQAKKSYPNFIQHFFQESIAEDQARLSEATAAYQAELGRLGGIAHLLTERPGDMAQEYLIRALKETDEIKKKEKHKRHETTTIWTRLSGIRLANVGRYKVRWNVEGRGRFSLRKMERQGHIESETAKRILFADASNAVWLRHADQWTRQARSVLGNILREIQDESVGDNISDEATVVQIRTEWSESDPSGWSSQAIWLKTLHVVDNLHKGRRIGEGKVLRLKDAALVHWTRQLDLYGIPSTALAVCIANMIHIRLTPYWPTFKKDGLALYAVILGIVRERFWFPAKSILDELMNKSPTIMSAFGLDIEETSLDHMLRDLGYGDGSPAMRREGLKFASEQYEDALQHNLVGNLIRGKLVRLMLIQVQQLKVGVLSALETIDVLMKGNRIYFSVLAGIPAVVLATYGTKFLLHFMYNIRSRDLRPVKTVHAEMKELLLQTEELLLLAKHKRGIDGTSTLALEPSELGQLLLTVHRYLILMDYSSPPFPSGQCDLIHENLRKMFGTDGILGRALEDHQRTMWIHLVQKKHQELLKHI